MVDLKRTDCQFLIQQRWVSSGSEHNCNPRFTTMASHEEIQPTAREEVGFYREGGSKQRALGFSLAEALPAKESFSCAISIGCESAPFCPSNSV